MILKNASYEMSLEKEFEPYFQILSTKHLTLTDKERVRFAIKSTVAHPEFNHDSNRKKLLVIISDKKNITLGFPSGAQGHQGNFAFLKYSAFTEYSEMGTLVVLTEEFVHYFWDSDDEEFVKSKVCEILPYISLDPSKTKYIFDKLEL